VSRFFLFVIIMFALDGVWWFVSLRLARGKAWRLVTSAFMGAQILGLACFILGRMFQTGWDRVLPKFAVSSIFIWHFVGLALLLLLGLILLPILLAQVVFAARQRTRAASVASHNESDWSRREFIGFAAAAVPPLVTFSLAGVGMTQLDEFRVRRLVIPITDLPKELEGLTIAHVSDMHVGRFTSGRVLRKMVDAVNELQADLVLLTGDLINDALADLASALDHVRALASRSGLWVIEGNHDLIENGAEFRRRMKVSGVPFLLDESGVIQVRDRLVQILGLSWTRGRGRERDVRIATSVRELLQQRNPEAFPILLAHHPHAFDAAAEARVPLTLSGHTHGGQLMFNEAMGFGPAMFRYWSGLYTRGPSRLVVSNGVGNWFPVRANAPAEIIHLTLRRGHVA
jgi:uncharacterized protein